MLDNVIDVLKKREELKAKRNLLFARFLNNPLETRLALKIKIVTADGGRVSYARAFGRYFAKMLSGFTCAIGFIIAAFDNPQKRALHDYICNTRVVYR